MRWLGLAKRCLDIAADYTGVRMSGGRKLAERESVQVKLGHCAMQVEIGRLLTMKAAALLDKGDFARKEISMAKVQVADTLHLCADTAIQLCGARGYSTDTPLEWIYRYARQARLVDGATEVHQQVLARCSSRSAAISGDGREARPADRRRDQACSTHWPPSASASATRPPAYPVPRVAALRRPEPAVPRAPAQR